ncbi:hypothetical protein WL73_25265 [Burkholderia ubonensis]|uniref:Uncharacterized protein n=1 Tax=Burkholderia ubonensis TaxID=101571 RepID=A0A107FJ44_9BURK|nr:hypothetical protein WL73_25265 [Burkholderia ubonensis]
MNTVALTGIVLGDIASKIFLRAKLEDLKGGEIDYERLNARALFIRAGGVAKELIAKHDANRRALTIGGFGHF